MKVSLSGILPELHWSSNEVPGGGRYVAEGWRGSLIQLRGNICWTCSASNAVGRLLWTAVGDSAGWRAIRRTHAAHAAQSGCSWHCTKSEWRPHDRGELKEKTQTDTANTLQTPPRTSTVDTAHEQIRNTRANTKTLPRPTLHRRGHVQRSTDVNPPHAKKHRTTRN